VGFHRRPDLPPVLQELSGRRAKAESSLGLRARRGIQFRLLFVLRVALHERCSLRQQQKTPDDAGVFHVRIRPTPKRAGTFVSLRRFLGSMTPRSSGPLSSFWRVSPDPAARTRPGRLRRARAAANPRSGSPRPSHRKTPSARYRICFCCVLLITRCPIRGWRDRRLPRVIDGTMFAYSLACLILGL
jgi:hypothetical protein